MLEVRIFSMEGLVLQTPFGEFQPRVSVEVTGSIVLHTMAQNVKSMGGVKTNSSSFDQFFRFPVRWPVTDPNVFLYIRVEDLNKEGRIVSLGYLWFALKDIDVNRPVLSVTFPLLQSQGGTLKIGFIPYTNLQQPLKGEIGPLRLPKNFQ
jgi:hypothetical protein